MEGTQLTQEGTSAVIVIASKIASVDLELPRMVEPTYNGFSEVYSPFAGLMLVGLFMNEGRDSRAKSE
jgi:hypothetical protein